MNKAVVLLSGGVDSSTTLAWARSEGFTVYALSVSYGQRAVAELQSAAQMAKTWGVVEHRVVDVQIGQWGGSALTDTAIPMPSETGDTIPSTYVPARNTILLSLALSWAETLGAYTILYGANVVDYSNYPDCRPEYIAAFEKMANLATRDGVSGQSFSIQAPLLNMTKADILTLGHSLGVDYSVTVSCYDANASGEACGVCDACQFRKKGFLLSGLEDVTRYRGQHV